ncbi:MAG: hypothetical protein IJO96_02015 [Oscillospiraceae bacterium]|nr:hypothetical protein [Oscillospiraceae bacterium]
MNDFMLLVALFIVTVITFVVPIIYLADTLLKSGWKDFLLGAITTALTYPVLRYLLFVPLYLSETENSFGRVVAFSAAAGAVCAAAKLPAVFLSSKKPIPFESAATVAKSCSAGMVILFAGINYLNIFALKMGIVFSAEGSEQKLLELPQKAKLFYAMSGGEDNLSLLLFGIIVLIPAVIYSADVIIVMYGLRAKKYWYPVIAAVLYAVVIAPAAALNKFGIIASLLYLFAIMFIALKLNLVCKEHYYMYDMIARIDEKKRTGRPPIVY